MESTMSHDHASWPAFMKASRITPKRSHAINTFMIFPCERKAALGGLGVSYLKPDVIVTINRGPLVLLLILTDSLLHFAGVLVSWHIH